MLEKTIQWIDPYNGQQRSQNFYFHVGMGDLARVELEYGFVGGLDGMIKEVIEAKDGERVMALFEKLIAMSYGRRTPDGDFIKTKQATQDFVGGRAYDALFYSLVTNATLASDFFNGIMPPEIKEKVREAQKERGETGSIVVDDYSAPQTSTEPPPAAFNPTAKVLAFPEQPDRPKAISEYELGELMTMNYEEFLELLARQKKGTVPRAILNLAYQRRVVEEHEESQR